MGRPGSGKSTLSHLLVWGWLGLLDEVLGMPVAAQESKVLYLAMDRPAQIARAMHRLMDPAAWKVIEERLIVRGGPLPVDITVATDWIAEKATEAGAGLGVIDSLKDVLPNPSDEERAGQYHRARNAALAAGVEWIEIHHNRKAGVGNKEPNALDDVYGSRWLTAGAGSVVSLWGEAGDTVVSMKQLKSPAGEFYPRSVLLDKEHGRMSMYDDLTLEKVVLGAGRYGVGARDAAVRLFMTDKPSKSQIESVPNRLKRMVRDGDVTEVMGNVDSEVRYTANADANVTNVPPTAGGSLEEPRRGGLGDEEPRPDPFAALYEDGEA